MRRIRAEVARAESGSDAGARRAAAATLDSVSVADEVGGLRRGAGVPSGCAATVVMTSG